MSKKNEVIGPWDIQSATDLIGALQEFSREHDQLFFEVYALQYRAINDVVSLVARHPHYQEGKTLNESDLVIFRSIMQGFLGRISGVTVFASEPQLDRDNNRIRLIWTNLSTDEKSLLRYPVRPTSL